MKAPSDMTDRELDAAVAVEVMGWKWMRYHDLDYPSPDGPLPRHLCKPGEWLDDGSGKYVECDLSNKREKRLQISLASVPNYSTDIAAAWEVVEAFGCGYVEIDNGWRERDGNRIAGWTCKIVAPGEEGEATAESAPRAICRAALAAVRGRK